MEDAVLHSVEGAVATPTLSGPDEPNAIDFATIDRLHALLHAIEAAESVRAVILTGAGDKALSAGADIHEFSEKVWAGPETALREFVRRGQRLTGRVESFPKPIVAVVTGLAFGGGCEARSPRRRRSRSRAKARSSPGSTSSRAFRRPMAGRGGSPG